MEPIIEPPVIAAHTAGIKSAASTIIDTGYLTVEELFDQATTIYSDLWLTKASRVIFMSYFVELPALDDAGLSKAWKGLKAVMARLQSSADFLVVASMEFRFVRGGDTALAGTYTETPKAIFVNLDLIGYVSAVAASDTPPDCFISSRTSSVPGLPLEECRTPVRCSAFLRPESTCWIFFAAIQPGFSGRSREAPQRSSQGLRRLPPNVRSERRFPQRFRSSVAGRHSSGEQRSRTVA